MLDAFEILTTSGIVLWRKHYAPLSPSVINSLINDVFIEERQKASGPQDTAVNAPYKKDKYTLKWTASKDVGVIFVAVYQSLLHLSWVDNLLTAAKALFTKQYGADVKRTRLTALDTRSFDLTFDALLRKLNTGSTQRRQSEPGSESAIELTPPSSTASVTDDAADDEPPPPPPSVPTAPHLRKPATPAASAAARNDILVDDTTSTDVTPVATPDTSRPSTPLQAPSHLLTAKGGPGRGSRKERKARNAALNASAPASSGDEGPARARKGGKSTVKSKRRWDVDGTAIEDDGDAVLDYSAPTTTADAEHEPDVDLANVKAEQMGNRTGRGEFVLRDLDDEVDAILASSRQEQQQQHRQQQQDGINAGPEAGLLGAATNKISGLFRNVVGGKTLSRADLQQPLAQMQNLLLQKNVAREAAERLTQSVETDLLNHKTASFTSIDKTIRESMSRALTHILTPTSSLDLLRSITSTTEGPHARPYVISIVGVNGVGKSTSLSKIAYFLLQNHFRVLVVAADTFRSGAVEQLRVHVRNLSELVRRESANSSSSGRVELFEKGYGKDAATLARDAVTYAASPGSSSSSMQFDVVLIDTAGRRHNDSRLMSSLTKFGQLANPDKIFMVGEALVGADAVAQARNFAREFVDARGVRRNGGVGMDGFIISKCDTVGDMVGTLVSMVHATGIPVVFLGVGQHYGDLRGLNVGWAVDKLMK